jgi:hypothetical protein
MKIFLVIVFLSFTGIVFSQVSTKSGLKVNGVAMGDSYQQVVRKLGKPTSQTKRKADECVGGTEMTLSYPGLKIRLWDEADDPKKFTVGWYEVKSEKWNVSGAKIGSTAAAVKKLFGNNAAKEIDSNTKLLTWYYGMDANISPDSTNFAFRNGKVVSITSVWLMC